MKYIALLSPPSLLGFIDATSQQQMPDQDIAWAVTYQTPGATRNNSRYYASRGDDHGRFAIRSAKRAWPA
jgi:hypothetical protein